MSRHGTPGTHGRRGRRGERGQATVLIIGFTIVVVLMVAVVVDASAAYLRRTALDSLADGAALAAADALQGRQLYQGGLGHRARIDPVVARRFVADYLSQSGAGRRYPGLVCRVDASPDRVVVNLSAPVRLPITPPGWERRPRISGTAASFVTVSD